MAAIVNDLAILLVSSVLVAVLPMLAVQSAWIPVGIGAAVTLVCVLFGEFVLRKSN